MALNQLRDNFSSLPDKQQVWNDLHRLANDEDISVRYNAISALGSAFSQVPDKQQAWNDLYKLALDEDFSVRFGAASALSSVYSYVPNKQKVWSDLYKLTSDEDWWMRVRQSAYHDPLWVEIASAIVSVFSDVPDKQKAWNELIKMTNVEGIWVRHDAASILGSVFSYVPDKKQACDDLHKLANDEDSGVRVEVASALGSTFSDIPDKQQAWNDLIKLTKDKDSGVRSRAASALGFVFSSVPDKQKAWNELIKLTNNEDWWVRCEVASALRFAFSEVPNKQKAWNDLHKLTNNKDCEVKARAASALGSAFSVVPNKQKAWNDLIKLSNDDDRKVRVRAASALIFAFSDLPDKQKAWNDLHRLTNDNDRWVRVRAASSLGSVFSDMPDKQKTWNDLIKLTNDEYSNVRTYANHSLGKVSIFKASQAENEEDYKQELEKAINFFEKAAQESRGYNPAQFCLPFYRSFHLIIFKRQEAKGEVDKYLVEAKDAIEGSKSKETLLGAVINLANALQEVQNLENLDLEAKKDELNFYRKYCDRAAELMKDTEETTPFATIAMRKGLPILDRNLKELLEEIQKKAKIACKESKGTATEEIACAVSKEVQKWEIGSQEEMAFNLENLVFTLEANTPHNPQSNLILDRIKQIPEQKDVAKQYGMLNSIITLIIKSSSEQKLQEIGEKVDQISDKLEEITISLKPGISEELIIHIGPITQWGGIEYTMSIPLQDISYPELKEDLQKIVGKKIDKLSKMPAGLASKVRDYLIQKNMRGILEKLT